MSVTYGQRSYVHRGDESEWIRHDVEHTEDGRTVDIHVFAYGGRVTSYRYWRTGTPCVSSSSERS